MSVLSPKKKNGYLDKINEDLISFFRTIEEFNQTLNDLSQLIDEATVHINGIERILGNNDEDEEEDENDQQRSIFEYEKESVAGEKLCELNENLNISMREIRKSWNELENQGAAISKSVYRLPKQIRLFLDTTKNDVDLNNSSFRSEITQLSDQLPIIGQFYYELSLEIQVHFLDLSSMKTIKHLSTILDLLSSRSASISVPIQIIRQIQIKLS